MATYAQAQAEVARLRRFAGVVPVLRKTGATSYELWVKDGRLPGQNQVAAAVATYQPGAWLATTAAATAAVIT